MVEKAHSGTGKWILILAHTWNCLSHTQEAEESLIYVGTTLIGMICCQKVTGCITKNRSFFRGPADEMTSQLRDRKSKRRHVWKHIITQPVANNLALMDVKLQFCLQQAMKAERSKRWALAVANYGARRRWMFQRASLRVAELRDNNLYSHTTIFYLKNKKPTRCHLLFYCTSYRLNMFRALLCPSSGGTLYTSLLTPESFLRS